MMKILLVVLTFLASLFGYCSSKSTNTVTGEKQYVALSPQEEIVLGEKSLPEMERQYGKLGRNIQAENLVDRIGNKLSMIEVIKKTPYKFDFHVIDSDKTINAFALPGGQVFITTGLLKRLKSEAQLAGVLGHEIGHVVARHGAEHIAKQKLTQGIIIATDIATYDSKNPEKGRSRAIIARMIGSMVNMKFGRNDELESDTLGLKFMSEAGYNPKAMIGVMEVLNEATKSGVIPEFFSTHPNPKNRIKKIEESIKKLYPNGIPSNLES